MNHLSILGYSLKHHLPLLYLTVQLRTTFPSFSFKSIDFVKDPPSTPPSNVTEGASTQDLEGRLGYKVERK